VASFRKESTLKHNKFINKMKQLYKIGLLLLFPIYLSAQTGLTNKGTTIKVGSSVNLKVSNGFITNKSSGQIINNGNIYLDLDFNQNTAATYTGSTGSWLWFDGNSTQSTNSDAPLNITGLKVDNGNKLVLNNTINVSNIVDLNNNGNIELGAQNLVLSSGATISGYDVNNYIITNSTGVLEQEVGASNVVFPIGNSSFNPATINNSGTLDNFQVRVVEQVQNQGTSGTIETDKVVDRTWLIEENTIGGSNATLTLQWATAEEMGSFNRNNSGIAHHLSGSLWDNPIFSAATSVGSGLWTQTRSGFTSFSPFVVRDLNAILPVELLNFDATRLDKYQVQLDWSTASEINNKGFYVERMLENEAEFSSISFVEGQGTSVETNSYQFIDENSYTGVSYYRLKQEDFDGTISYSEIKAVAGIDVSNTNYIDLSIYPNPVFDQLNVHFGELPESITSAEVKIIAINGQVLHRFETGLNPYQVLEIKEVRNLVPAMYMLSIELDNGERVLQKFIKE
jgi:hypothetical protein